MSTINYIHVAASPLILLDPVHLANQITYIFYVHSLTRYHLCDLAWKLLPLDCHQCNQHVIRVRNPRHMHLKVFEAAKQLQTNYNSSFTVPS
jgi:hypothetical protein